MRNVFLLLCMASAFMLAACTAPIPRGDLGPTAGGGAQSTGSAVIRGAQAGTLREYMDWQEADIRDKLGGREGSMIRRTRTHLLITFKSDLFFDPDSSALRAGASDEINRVAVILKTYPDTQVQINGYTDSIGSEQYNLELSKRRAAAVKDSLVESGVAAQRLTAHGFGETRHIASNATEAGRQTNRRITLIISPARS